jgi:hypothetical protein
LRPNPNAVFRGHPEAFAPYVFDGGAYRPRCHCDDGGLLLLPQEKVAFDMTVEAARQNQHGRAGKLFPEIMATFVVNLEEPARWLMTTGGLDVAGGHVYPQGVAPQPQEWPATLDYRREVDARHGTRVHHHHLEPEHRHRGQPSEQTIFSALKALWRR